MQVQTFSELFLQRLMGYVEAESLERPYDVIHPSEITTCLRQYKYKQIKAPKNPADSNLITITELGKAGHEYMGIVIPKLMPEYTVVGIEIPINDPTNTLRVGGHADMLLQHILSGEYLGLDFKFLSSSSFKSQMKQLKPAYMAQAMSYMHFLQLGGIPVKQWEVILWNKSPIPASIRKVADPPIYGHRIDYHPLFMKMYWDRMVEIQKVLDTDKIPPREHLDPAEEECMFCEYSNHCWEEG